MTDQELNEAVARKLGDDACHHSPRCLDTILKDYATDISAAWEIVEDAGFYVELKRAVGRQWRCSLGNLVEPVLADTAPKAICLAFLKLGKTNGL